MTKDMTVEDILVLMKELFESTDKELDKLREELGNSDKEQSDLLHYIENNILNAGGYAKVGKKIKFVRGQRREIKYDIERLEVLKVFTLKYNNKFIVKDIIQTLKGLQEIKNRQRNPSYKYRTNIIKDMGE